MQFVFISLYFLEDEFYVPASHLNLEEHGGVAVVTGKRVVKIEANNKTVRLDNGWEIAYDKCLIATGGRPKSIPAVDNAPDSVKQDRVTFFRDVRFLSYTSLTTDSDLYLIFIHFCQNSMT